LPATVFRHHLGEDGRENGCSRALPRACHYFLSCVHHSSLLRAPFIITAVVGTEVHDNGA